MDNTLQFRDFAAILYRAGVLTTDQYESVKAQIDDLGADGSAAGILAGILDSELRSANG
jgi:hypothetical protein